VECVIKYVWNIRWWPALAYGSRYFVRVEYIIKKVSVGYACRRLPTAVVYGVLLKRIARLSTSEVGILSVGGGKPSPAVNVFKVWDLVGLIIKCVWKIRWWLAFDYGSRYFVRVEYIIKKVSVGYGEWRAAGCQAL